MNKWKGRSASRGILALALGVCLVLGSLQAVSALAGLHPQDENRVQVQAARIQQVLTQQASNSDAVAAAEYLTLPQGDSVYQDMYQAASAGTYLAETIFLPDGRQGVVRVEPVSGQLITVMWNTSGELRPFDMEILDSQGVAVETRRLRHRQILTAAQLGASATAPALEELPSDGLSTDRQLLTLSPGQMAELRLEWNRPEIPSGVRTEEGQSEPSAPANAPDPYTGGQPDGLWLKLDVVGGGAGETTLLLYRSRDNQSWESQPLTLAAGETTIRLEDPEAGYTYQLRPDRTFSRDDRSWALEAIALDPQTSTGVSGGYDAGAGVYSFARITGAASAAGIITVTYQAPEGNPEPVTNTMEQELQDGAAADTGRLVITASVSDGSQVATAFKITDAKGNTFFAAVKGSGSAQIMEVPLGSCTVEEIPFADDYRAGGPQTCTITPEGGSVAFTVYRLDTGVTTAMDDNL